VQLFLSGHWWLSDDNRPYAHERVNTKIRTRSLSAGQDVSGSLFEPCRNARENGRKGEDDISFVDKSLRIGYSRGVQRPNNLIHKCAEAFRSGQRATIH